MKFDIECLVFKTFFSKLLVDYFKVNKPEVDYKPLVKATKKEYKAMIVRTPGLSKDNQMASNLKGAAYFFAMAKVIPNMTPAWMDEIINYAFNCPLIHKVYDPKKKKGTLFSQKEKDKMYKDSLRSQKSEDEMDWRFTYHQTDKNECLYEIHKCGVCRLAERENLKDYLPCMCKMDYPKYKLLGGTLHRDKTLANNDECCNFHIIKDE